MPLQVQPLDSKLKLKYEIGTDGEGNPKYSTRTFSNVKPAADNEDLYDIAIAFSELQEHPLVLINRVDEMELVDL